MKQIKKRIQPMNLKEKLFFYLNVYERNRRKEVKDYANRKKNLYNHVLKQERSENIYILICTILFSLVLFGFMVIGFLLSAHLLVKIVL